MAETVKDLVCDMDIDPETAAATSEYNGTTYYFCAAGCKVDFDADPQKYVGGTGQPKTEAAAEPMPEMAGEPAKAWWQFWK